MSTTPMRVDGIDISHHQPGTLDLEGAHRRGLKWMYHKATEGNGYVDPMYAKRRDQAKKVGLPFGAYHFARPSRSDAITEARHFLAVAKPVPGDLRPALDLETTEGLHTGEIRAWAHLFVTEVEKAIGVKPIVYTPFDLGDYVKGCLLWRPRYNNDNRRPELHWDIWQFSNGVYGLPRTLAGIGRVDLNVMRAGLELSDMRIPLPKPKPAPKPKVKTLDFRVNLVPGAKKLAPSSVIRDMHLVVETNHTSGVVFNTERETPDLRRAVEVGLGKGWTRVIDNECTIAHGSSWHPAQGRRPYAVLLAKEDPSRAGVSPRRLLNVDPVEHVRLDGHPIAMAGTHLVSEANCIHVHVRGRAWREKTYEIQLRDVIAELLRLHRAGLPIVFAGDLNTGVHFTGKELEARLRKVFGDQLTHVHNGKLDHVFLISTDKVKLTAGKPKVVDNASDHDMVSVMVTATVKV